MTRGALLLLALCSLAFAPAPLPRRQRDDAGLVELSRLTPADAARLQGRRLRYRIVFDSAPGEADGWTCYDCRHDDTATARVSLPGTGRAEDAGGVLVVRGRVRVVVHEVRGDRMQYGGYVALVLVAEDERPVREDDD